MLQRKLRNQEEHKEVDFLIQKKQKLNDDDGPEESVLTNPSAEAGFCQSSRLLSKHLCLQLFFP